MPEQGAEGAEGAAGAATSGSSRTQATRNYELDRTISYTRHQQGRIRRLTVAVAVDDIANAGGNGQAAREPWSENDLQRLTLLVRDAVGYSAVRGDSVNVINTTFVGPETIEEIPDPPIWEQGWFWDLLKNIGAGLFLLILVFGVLRPIMRSLSSAPEVREVGDDSGGELEGISESTSGMGGDHLTVDDSSLLPGPNESYERQVEAVRSLVAEDPGRVAQVVKRWLNADE